MPSSKSLEKRTKIREDSKYFLLPAAEDLHPEESEDEDEEAEKDQQRHDRGDGVDEGLDQVTHSGPVPRGGKVSTYSKDASE